MKLQKILFLIACMGIAATATFAEEAKFSVEGDTLYYNTEKPGLNRSFVSLSERLISGLCLTPILK